MKNTIEMPLILRIQRSGKISQKVIHENEKFTLGQSPENDLTLFGQEFPKRHILFEKRNGYFKLNLPNYVKEGEIKVGESRLNLKELIVHDILPRENNGYTVKLAPNKQGYLTVGDTRIEFLFERRKIIRQVIPQFDGFAWLNVAFKGLFSDLTFKLIFLFLFTLNAVILYLFKDYEVKIEEKVDVAKVSQRFAKFILKAPEEIAEISTSMTASTSEEDTDANGDKQKEKSAARKGAKRGSGKGGGNPAASSGLLSLIGGTGEGTKTSNVVDALVDRGLVADLKSILGGGTNLKVGGQKTKDGIDPLDQLIGTGGSGGIDDFLSAMDEEVEEVTLKKTVRVNLATATSKSGSEEALGYRSEQSVMSVVNARMGRITWIYEKYLKRQPNLMGKVSIQFTIAANGFVTEVRILESTINHPQLENDIVNLIKRLKFDPIPSGNATFVFPFHFKKME